MNLSLLNPKIKNYTNNSQKVRVMTEPWTEENIFCPNCGSDIKSLANNKPVSDYLCKKCKEYFEQKASKKKFGKKVVSSEYKTMISKLNSLDKPNFFFMHYLDQEYLVNDFFVIPKHFFVPEIIEKRKPLSGTARRAGWTGANILLDRIPESGQIYYIKNGQEFSKKEVLHKWQKTVFLKDIKKPESKGWIIDIMKLIDRLGKKQFLLEELYQFEEDLKKLHPENNNIKPKIRQQLQFLRDRGYLEFTEKGLYTLK